MTSVSCTEEKEARQLTRCQPSQEAKVGSSISESCANSRCQLRAALVGHPGTLPLWCPFQPPGTHWGVSWVVTLAVAVAVGRGGPASWEERRHQGTSQWTSWLTPPLTLHM